MRLRGDVPVHCHLLRDGLRAHLLKQCLRYEEYINSAHKEILRFISRIFQSGVSDDLSTEISALMRVSYHIERIGNTVVNINRQLSEVIEEDKDFSPEAWGELEMLAVWE